MREDENENKGKEDIIALESERKEYERGIRTDCVNA